MVAFAQGPTPIGPNKISFQAVVRDSANKLVSNVDNINVGIEVIDEANYDKVYYAENHFPVESNVNGLISLLVGTGDVLSGSFDSIPWQNVCFRTTITVPDNRPVVGISPIAAVPYALYASNVDSLIKRIDSLERRVNDSIANGEIGPKLECEIHLCTNGLTVTILESPIGKVDWGDGKWSAATGYDVSHTYDTTGTYTLHLYSQGVCSVSKTINLNIPPCTGTKRANEVGGNGQITAVKDEQGHVYRVVQIGSQCWMAENVRKTLDPIPDVPHRPNLAGANRSVFLNDDLVSPFYPKSYMINPEDSSVLYNWMAAVDAKRSVEAIKKAPAVAENFTPNFLSVYFTAIHNYPANGINLDNIYENKGNFRGICPQGWHLPTFSEFQTLYNYTGCSPMDGMGDLHGYGKLAGGCSWKSCDSYHLESESMTTGSACAEAPGNYDYAERNSTFFSALPYTTSLTITNDRSTDLLAPFSNLGGNIVRSVITLLRELGVGKNDNDYSEACALISIDDAYDKTHFWTRDEHIDQCCLYNDDEHCGGDLVHVNPNFGSNIELKYIMSYFARTATVMSNGYIEGANNYRSQAEMHAVRCVRNAE